MEQPVDEALTTFEAAEFERCLAVPQYEVRESAWRRLASVLRSVCGSGLEVEDAVQDSMLALLEAQERGESIGNSCAFCVRIARRRMIDECRRTRPVAAGSLTERASDEISALDAGVEVDWVSRLANEGVHLTPVLKCVLSRITSGMAETKHWRSRRVSDQRIGEATQFTLDTNGPQARREVVFECTPATAGIKADLIAAMSEGWDTTVTDQNEDRTFDDDDTLDFQQ